MIWIFRKKTCMQKCSSVLLPIILLWTACNLDYELIEDKQRNVHNGDRKCMKTPSVCI